ncbi:XRE family transcriptional regulator [Nocardiopsis tropica]|uniref:helix-turn-helix domain-containing protein n=1 Tax=Tsukamurella strandjordii TaxID=147577 RepID=UPI0031CF1161
MPTPDIGGRLRELRTERGLSLSELARRAGVGKGSLSEIEAGGRNPTVETLYSLCGPLDVPLTALLGEAPGSDGTAHGGMRTVLLSVRHLPHITVEVFRLEFPEGSDHTSPGHGPEVREHLTVVDGMLLVGPVGKETTVQHGDSHAWTSDGPHRFAAVDGPAEAVVVITTPR